MVFILSEKFRAAEGQERTMERDVLSQESFECSRNSKITLSRQGDLGINMVFILSEKFRAAKGQERTMERDVLSQEKQLCFSKPIKEMANHLRPLFITANFGGDPIPKVMVDGGAAINLLPHRLLVKLGKTEKDLIPTRLTITNFAWAITKTYGILDVHVIVGTKKLKIAFLVVDTTSTTYNALLRRDWINQKADPRPFLPSALCFEAKYYHNGLGPFTFFGVNQSGRPHGVTA
ncbi:unnamed protein product [Prunus armeniaca]